MSRSISTEAMSSILIGILVIAGIGFAGATIDSMQPVGAANETDFGQETPAGGGGQSGAPPGGEFGETNNTSVENANPTQPISRCVEPLASTTGTGMVVLGFLAIIGLVFYRYNFSAALLVGWTVLPPVALVYFLLTNCGESGGSGAESGPSLPGSGTALDISPNIPPWAMLGVTGLLLLGAIGIMYRTVSEEEVEVVQEETEEDVELDRFAEAAGRAADRIEEQNVDVDNAVYRAWVEMTDLIEVDNPDTYAAGEFAAVAIDLGMDRSDVEELTELFNEVRYGDRDAATREDRALSVLRNIESQYGTEAEDAAGDRSAGADPDVDGGPADGDAGQPDSDESGEEER